MLNALRVGIAKYWYSIYITLLFTWHVTFWGFVLRFANRFAHVFVRNAKKSHGTDDWTVVKAPLNPLLTLSALEMAEMLRAGNITAVELTKLHIDRIKETHPVLNAVIHERFEEALQEAHEADAKLSHARKHGTHAVDQLPPLLGVPCTIKENFLVKGCPNSSGHIARKDFISPEDAPVVGRIRQAGAIILGLTNVSELCMWMESYNYVYGFTRNPYSPDRIVGGSSGGQAAIVAAGGSPFGLGSDVGGSIRMPAFFCGVFGHKPSVGRVPNVGQHPPACGAGQAILGTGPICRRAVDLPVLLRIFQGPDPRDPFIVPMPLPDPFGVVLSSLNVMSMEGIHHPLISPLQPELREVQRQVYHFLVTSGMHPVISTSTASRSSSLSPPGSTSPVTFTTHNRTAHSLHYTMPRHTPHEHHSHLYHEKLSSIGSAAEMWSSRMERDMETLFSEYLYLNEGAVPAKQKFNELYRWMRGESDYTLPAIALSLVEGLSTHYMPAQTEAYANSSEQLRDDLVHLLKSGNREGGVLLFPSYTRVAPKHFTSAFTPADWAHTALWNAVGVPVTQVPLGLSSDGLPLGIQVVGTPGNDHHTIAVAIALERAFGGWRCPKF